MKLGKKGRDNHGITDKVEYLDRLYKLRLLHFGDDWGGPYWVASSQLGRIVWDDEKGYPSYEAQRVDELIFFFIPAHWFKLPDKELRDMILPNL
ncbi:MAG: hypothetical protein AAB037_07255 [Chloroflexota bacterium]